MGPLSLLIWLLIFCVVAYAVFLVLGHLALPEPLRTLVVLVAVLILLFWLLGRLGMAVP